MTTRRPEVGLIHSSGPTRCQIFAAGLVPEIQPSGTGTPPTYTPGVRLLGSALVSIVVSVGIAGCGASVSSHGNRIVVSQTGTYTYQLQLACLTPTKFSPAKSTPGFQLVAPGRFYEALHGTTGKVWLTAGRWGGVAGYFSAFDPTRADLPPTFSPHPCSWSMILSP